MSKNQVNVETLEQEKPAVGTEFKVIDARDDDGLRNGDTIVVSLSVEGDFLEFNNENGKPLQCISDNVVLGRV